jgi:hypothetical protein
VVPPRMIHIEIYGAMASSFGATQLLELPSLNQSTHNMRNVGF